ncbi:MULTISPECIES: transposase [Clostridium]|uniref:Transposase n=2 Tax=Clostridium TaxID=1485 RepID=A0AAU8Z399_CLOBO|nr:transposase [Clostridium sporogenes]AVP66441.1 transposase [Clostridium botulinum]MCF4017528.1 transposase [Clostridium sporogenes]MCW6087548.1 transposase [Clostridium sporogenes]NFF63914.1 transposase [Clostridium sporogenes]NFF65820.1 transposase [Clostridium sporogenes]
MFYLARVRRYKREDGIYHIIVRSISEIQVFKNDKDKEIYLSQMKHYKEIYNFKVYAYCIMSNHAHFIIDSNGADISKIMHGLNLKYAMTYNKIYKRHGHLFQDRFKSKIVESTNYLITLSAYIHNNPLQIRGYKECPERYKYSSLKVYLGMERDKTGLLDEDYIMQIFGHNPKKARKKYIQFVYMCDNEKLKEEGELENQKTEYRSEKTVLLRNFNSRDIIQFISEETEISRIMIYMKNNKKSKEARALTVLLMRCLCDYKVKDICKAIGNVTQPTVSRMCSSAVELIQKKEKYKNIINKFIKHKQIQIET